MVRVLCLLEIDIFALAQMIYKSSSRKICMILLSAVSAINTIPNGKAKCFSYEKAIALFHMRLFALFLGKRLVSKTNKPTNKVSLRLIQY